MIAELQIALDIININAMFIFCYKQTYVQN